MVVGPASMMSQTRVASLEEAAERPTTLPGMAAQRTRGIVDERLVLGVLDEQLARGVLADLHDLLEAERVLQDRVQRSQRDLRQDRDQTADGGKVVAGDGNGDW